MLEGQINSFEPNKKNGWRALARIFIFILRLIPSILAVFGIALGALIIIAAIMILPYFSTLKSVYLNTHSAVENIKLAQVRLIDYQFEKAKIPLIEAKNRFSRAQSDLELLHNSFYQRAEYVNQQILGINDLLEIGEQLSDSLIKVADIGTEFMNVIHAEQLSLSQLSRGEKHEILGSLYNAGPQLEKIQSNLTIATDKLDEFNDRPIFPLIDQAAEPIKGTLPKYEPIFEQISVYGKILPLIVGYLEQQNYLFLLQNNDELRPGGGFIGTYGFIKVKDAEFVDLYTDNIYNLDWPARDYLFVESPDPIAQYLRQQYWFMRDANWWPDFPKSAQNVLRFYRLENGPEKNIDGVVAIDQSLIEDLLTLTGPITIEDITFTQENFTEKLQFEVEKGYELAGIPEPQRKDIIAPLSREIVNRLLLLPRAEWPDLIDLIENNIEQKHLMIYSTDPDLQKKLEKVEWDAGVYTGTDDYLAVVDSNMAALKTDATMERSYKYELEETKEGLFAKVNLHYENKGEFTWKTTRYRTYNRIYVPKNSQLISYKFNNTFIEPEEMDIFKELNKQVFGFFFIVEPKAQKDIEIIYKLPDSVAAQLKEEKYRLIVQKQPGLDEAGLEVYMEFIKPFTDHPKIMERAGQAVFWQGDMRTDMEFEVEF